MSVIEMLSEQGVSVSGHVVRFDGHGLSIRWRVCRDQTGFIEAFAVQL